MWTLLRHVFSFLHSLMSLNPSELAFHKVNTHTKSYQCAFILKQPRETKNDFSVFKLYLSYWWLSFLFLVPNLWIHCLLMCLFALLSAHTHTHLFILNCLFEAPLFLDTCHISYYLPQIQSWIIVIYSF